jgi:hypothetical protein
LPVHSADIARAVYGLTTKRRKIKSDGGYKKIWILLVYLFMFPAQFPQNAVPQWADIVLGIIAPRVLILIYIFQNMGADNVWFIAHLVVMILAYFGGSRETVRRRRVRED